nr:Fic family protein [Janthinobacterium sp. CG3]
MPDFRHFDLKLLNPSFDSPLVDVLTELEHLRRLKLGGTTPASTFFQLKHIFHMLESLGSARIEGNHTTLADYVETSVKGGTNDSDQVREISNIEKAMQYVEDVVTAYSSVSEHFVRELHALAVHDLEREGDRTPGAYRTGAVRIAKSDHLPPDPVLVPGYMEELIGFINRDDAPKYALIKVALAHHRFGWIHPFSNGNGRVVRLMTYALLIKYGFHVKTGGRVLNPIAVFCMGFNDIVDRVAADVRISGGATARTQARLPARGPVRHQHRLSRANAAAFRRRLPCQPGLARALTPRRAAQCAEQGYVLLPGGNRLYRLPGLKRKLGFGMVVAAYNGPAAGACSVAAFSQLRNACSGG